MSVLVSTTMAKRVSLVIRRHTLPVPKFVIEKYAEQKNNTYQPFAPKKSYYAATAIADLVLPTTDDDKATATALENGKIIARGPDEDSVGLAAFKLDERLIGMVAGLVVHPGRAVFAETVEGILSRSKAQTVVRVGVERDGVGAALDTLLQGVDVG